MSPGTPNATDRELALLLQDTAVFAGRAPSIHNSQPWRWRIGDGVLDLFLTRSRLLHHTDPEARLAVLSCGTALHHARIQLAATGGHAVVRRMPDPGDSDHLARLRVDRLVPVDPAAGRLARAAADRHTDRRTRPGPPLDADKMRIVARVVRDEGGMLTLIRPNQMFDLAAAMEQARTAMAGVPRWQTELSDWIGGDRPFGTGVPDAAMAPDPMRPGPAGHDLSRPGRALIADTHHRAAVFAVLHGAGNERLDWLLAGEALSAAWLTATRLDVSVLPLSAVIEVAGSRRAIRRLAGGFGYPFLVLRFAAMDPDRERPAMTPRLPASTVIEGFKADRAR